MNHQPPFFCPYCGEEDIRPHGETHGEWECESCRRVYALRSIRPGAATGSAGEPTEVAR